MEKAINFYELKTELADLGFVDPALVDSLRQAIFADSDNEHLLTGLGNTAFDLELLRDEQQRLSFVGYTASHGAGTPDFEIITFGPQISAAEAIETLNAPVIALQDNPVIAKFIAAGFDHFKKNDGFRETLRTHSGPAILSDQYEVNGQRLNTDFYFQEGQFKKLEATLINVHIPKDYLNGTDPAMLDRLMGNTGWMVDRHDPSERHTPMLLRRYAQVDRELQTLINGKDPRGADIADQLMVKHWLGTPYDHRGFLDEAAKAQYTVTRSYDTITPLHTIYEQLKLNNMNTENLSYLQKQQKNLGFGEDMYDALQKKIEAKEPEFTLNALNTYNKQDVNYTLHYKLGNKDENYFFNKYDAQVNDQQHTFYLNKGQGITAKEAFNLMEGRAVYKHLENLEGEKYNAWVVLEKDPQKDALKLKPYTDGWNYKPEKAIDKMDIVGINEEGARDKLMKSLEKGNRHQVSAMKNGKEVQLYIEANPADHRLNLTNYKGEPQRLDDYKKAEFRQEKKEDKKETQKETTADDTKKKRSAGKKLAA